MAGRGDELKGWVKEGLGKLMGNEWLEAEVLPRSRNDHKLPAELYVDSLQTFGVRMSPAYSIPVNPEEDPTR